MTATRSDGINLLSRCPRAQARPRPAHILKFMRRIPHKRASLASNSRPTTRNRNNIPPVNRHAVPLVQAAPHLPRILPRARGQRRHHLRLRQPAGDRPCRRRRRLQPRQRGQGLDADGARFHGADAVEGGGDRQRPTSCRPTPRTYFNAMFTQPASPTSTSTRATRATADPMSWSTARSTCRPRSWASSVSKITVTDSSTGKWGSTRLRVALVLDNTGSMADAGKMTALQDRDQEPARPVAVGGRASTATSMSRSFRS